MKEKLDVLEAAARLAAEEGSEALTIDRLAAMSGVSRSTIYRRYGGREGVLTALAERGIAIDRPQTARARILAAVAELIGRQGRLSATVAEIAAQAQVSAVTIFRLFGDRATLLKAFLDEQAAGPTRAPAADEPLQAALLAMATADIARAQRFPGLVRIALGPLLAEDDALRPVQVRREWDEQNALDFFEARLRAHDTRGVPNPRVVSAYWRATLDAEGLHLPASGDVGTAQEASRRAVDYFLRAFAGNLHAEVGPRGY